MEYYSVKLNEVTQLLDEMMFKMPAYCRKEINKDKFVNQVLVPRLNEIEKYLDSVEYTFMLGEKITSADVYVYLIDKLMKQIDPKVNDRFAKLSKLIERVGQDEKVSKFEKSDRMDDKMDICDPCYFDITYGIGI